MSLRKYLTDEKLDESSAINMYAAMLNSVDAAIQVIDAVIKESEDAKNLKYLMSAHTKLKSAYSDLKKIPIEAVKNIAVGSILKLKDSIKSILGFM